MTHLEEVMSAVVENGVQRIVALGYYMTPLLQPECHDLLNAARINIIGVTNIFEAARLGNLQRVVFPSTVGIFGYQDSYGADPIDENTGRQPFLGIPALEAIVFQWLPCWNVAINIFWPSSLRQKSTNNNAPCGRCEWLKTATPRPARRRDPLAPSHRRAFVDRVAHNGETFPLLETRQMKGGACLSIRRLIRGSAVTKAAAISVPCS